MEKEKKGLFGQLMDFWKEKIGIGETDSIGFWHEKGTVENHFAEMGAVAVMSQQEKMENSFLEKRKEAVIEEERKGSTSGVQKEEERVEEKRTTGLFTAELFREEKQAEAGKEGMGKTFFLEKPVEETEERRIILVAAEMVQEKETVVENEREIPEQKTFQKEETKAESVVDIEKLMRQMTKKLWEERESCGRRLR